MKLPNGFGSIYKLKGNRRNPYMVVLTTGYVKVKNNMKREKMILGYYSTKKEALVALTEYHENPYDIKVHTITFAEVYEKWSEDHFQTLKNKSSIIINNQNGAYDLGEDGSLYVLRNGNISKFNAFQLW